MRVDPFSNLHIFWGIETCALCLSDLLQLLELFRTQSFLQTPLITKLEKERERERGREREERGREREERERGREEGERERREREERESGGRGKECSSTHFSKPSRGRRSPSN